METAYKRLKTIAANIDLGVGLVVAQKDLEIRGAGNLLGEVQSDHVEGVGFDLYVHMVADAVAAYRGQAREEKNDPRLDIVVDAYIPKEYVPGERLRLEVYAKTAAIASSEQGADVREELIDCYGPLSREVELLFLIPRLRHLVRPTGIEEIVAQGKYVHIGPVELRDSQVLRLKRLHPGSVIKVMVRQVFVPFPLAQGIGGTPLVGKVLLQWVETLATKVLTPFSS